MSSYTTHRLTGASNNSKEAIAVPHYNRRWFSEAQLLIATSITEIKILNKHGKHFCENILLGINFPVSQKFLPLWACWLCRIFLLLCLSLRSDTETSHKKQSFLAVDVAYLSWAKSYKNITYYQCVFMPNKISDIIGRSHKKIKVVLAPLSIYCFILSVFSL